jgi:hypothetical protein
LKRQLPVAPQVDIRQAGLTRVLTGESFAMSSSLEHKRSLLVAALKNPSAEMRQRLEELKAKGEELRKRPDLLWHLLLQSAATQGNSRGWDGLCGDPMALKSVDYFDLARLEPAAREEKLVAALRKANVRMFRKKARQLSANICKIAEMGGVEEATRRMLNLPSLDEKFRFMKSFAGIGDKYGRNVWMDIYDQSFRHTVAFDERLKKVAEALGLVNPSYSQAESFYCAIAKDAGLEPWELDRLLYQFKKHFLRIIEQSEQSA